jgi:hypothetical protein
MNEIKYIILYLVPVPELQLITVPVPVPTFLQVKVPVPVPLRFLRFRFRFRFHYTGIWELVTPLRVGVREHLPLSGQCTVLLGLLGVESSMGPLGPLRECRRRRPRSCSPVLLHIDSHLGGYGLGTSR